MSGMAPDWTWALLTAVGVAAVLAVVRKVLGGRLRALSARTETRFDDQLADLVERTHPGLFVVLGAWAGLRGWLPDSDLSAWAWKAVTIALLAQSGVWGTGLVAGLAARRQAEAVAAGNTGDATAWSVLAFCARVAVWSVVGLVGLDNLGVDVTALVAGLGIGGLAIGLAVQNVLGDLLASLAIVLDRPFAIGDFLAVGDVQGTVEHVGLKTTRLRALSGEQIVMSNADLLQSRIRNFKRMNERRVVLTFGVLYETPAERLEAIPGIVRELVTAQPGTRFDRAHLSRFGDSSIDFEAVYYLADPDYTRHMDVQQAILLGLFRRFADLGVGFAYPTRTLWVHDARAQAGEALPVEEIARAGK